MTGNKLSVFIGLLCVVPIAQATDESGAKTDRLSIGAGVEYSSGTYGGATSTEIVYIPLTTRYVHDRYSLSLTIPYISKSSADQAVVPGVGRMGSSSMTGTGGTGMGGGMRGGMTGGGSSSTSSSQSGLGDVTTTFGYDLISNRQLGITTLGGIKFGTADYNKGLGTGQNDYFAEIDGSYSFVENSLQCAVGYKYVGSPASYSLNNYAFGSVGVNHRVNERSFSGLMLNGAQSSNIYSANPLALAASYSYAMSSESNFAASLGKGLSSGSPDWDGWLNILVKF